MNELCPMPGCSVERITRDGPGFLHIAAHGTRPGGRCPDCGRASRAVHSRYRRRPADLPSLGRAVGVDLRVRRFYCRNAACARRTFAERLPELLGPRARRTCRLAEAQGRVGVALGGEGGARLLQHLAMPASADTVLRLVRGLPLPEPEPPRVVGVDDWALRKGRTYGTIVVDLERRRVLDLLPDRTAETLADWLRRQPQIAVVARDRSTEYARGILLGAPAATQVADRWHLLANVRQVLERWLAGAHARLRRLPPSARPARGRANGVADRAFRRTRAETAARDGRRARWVALYEEVRRRHAAGEKLLAIGRAMGLAVGTVRKYAYAESFPVPETRPLRPSILDPYLARLEARLAEGCENGLALWRELRAAGFPGDGRAGAPLARGAPDGTGPDHPARVAGRVARRRADAGRPGAHPRCPRRRGWRGCSSNPRRSCRRPMQPSWRGSSRTARRRASPGWRAGSPRSCAGAAPARSSTPTRRSPGWRPGSPTLALPACGPWRRSRPGWSRTVPRSAPRSPRPGAAARPRARSPASSC